MKKRFDKVYQFKITLKGIKPPIWRRIQVPETYTFWDLHVAIQDAMGWEDYHLHEFEMRHPSTGENVRIGTPTEEAEFFGLEIISEHHQKIADWFSMENRIANYTYDFGDNWEHKIRLAPSIIRPIIQSFELISAHPRISSDCKNRTTEYRGEHGLRCN